MVPGENQYRQLIENLPDAFAYHQVITDNHGSPVDYTFLYVNPAFEKMTGLSKDEVIGRKVTEVLPGIEGLGFDWIDAYGKMALDGEPVYFEQYSEPLERWYGVTAYSDTPGFFATVFRLPFTNIQETVSTKTLMALTDAEEELRIKERALASSNNAMAIADLEGNLTYVNRTFLHLWGYEQEEQVLGRSVPAFWKTEEKVALIIKELKDKGCYSGELVAKRADGRFRDMQVYAATIYARDGTPLGLTYSFIDITDQKQTKEKLVQSEQEKNLILSSMTELVVYHDPDLTIRWANRASCDDFGLESHQIIGRRCHELLKRRGEECQKCPVRLALETEQYHENIVQYPDGKTQYIRASPFFAESGRLLGIVEIIQDITERNRSEAELKKAKEKAEAADRAKSRFLANISHEIRTPMNVIIGMTDLLHGSGLNVEQLEYAGMIKDSATNLLSIINDILDFSKIEADRIELIYTRFNLVMEVEKIVSRFYHEAEKKGLELTYYFDDGLPNYVAGDLTRINQVLNNLLGNAIKYTARGKVELKASPVKVTTEEAAHQGTEENFSLVCFAISDTGSGIPADEQGKLFQSFTRLTPTETLRQEGTGLGLVISKNLVELMGGKIWADSKPGRGSTFYFTVPFKRSGPDERITPITEEPGRKLGLKGEALDLLVAEDKPMNQKLVKAILERIGHRIKIAASGKEVLKAVQAQRFDAVLMDINMPEMDGLEATRRIRAREREAGGSHLPIIAMTAYAMNSDREKCLEAGMDGFIAKPIDTVELQRALMQTVYGQNELIVEKAEDSNKRAAQSQVPQDISAMLKQVGGNIDLMGELAEMFFDDYRKEMPVLEQALEKNDFDSISVIIHGFKGELGNLGMDSAYQLAIELDKMLKNNTPGHFASTLELFKARVGKLEKFFSTNGWQKLLKQQMITHT